MGEDVFCSSKIRNQVFLENKHFMVLYNISPLLPGHALIVPKRHMMEFFELNEEELVSLSSMLKKLIPKLLEVYNSDSYNLSVNYGRPAGMSQYHLHFHFVPRNSKDEFQQSLTKFYWLLEHEREGYVRDVSKEIARLRRIFKYEPQGRAK